ncbi:MAG: antibiotic biosynthesis monooxygenase [Desulfobacterales bacterium]|nr:antibiotic biosynthesis monooxygenase [Desulfobacterales bacterium]
MTVKILIKRKVTGFQSVELIRLLNQMRALTMGQDGYMTGETLNRIDKADESLVISTWRSVDDWRRWVLSDQRREIQEQIDALLGQPTAYEIYEHGVF